VRCRLCSGGKTHCLACGGALKSPCRSCNGTGRATWPCPVGCANGRLACPASGAKFVATPPCPWCADKKLRCACGLCAGVGFLGCKECFGTLRVICGKCGGTGEVRMVYTDGTTASASKCSDCDGKGYAKCEKCGGLGKQTCTGCAGAGRVPRVAADCGLCGGTNALAAPGWNLLRAKFTPVTPEEVAAHQKMIDGAVQFLMTCKDPRSGAFALRGLRKGRNELPAQPLERATPFSNAMCLWTLAIAGRPMDAPEFAEPRERLRKDAKSFVDGTADYKGSQAAGLTLRAMSAVGEDAASPVMKGLVEKIVKGQHGDGLWGDSLDDPKDPSDPFDTLFVAESLRLARIKGVKVPYGTWSKLLRAATLHLDSRALSPKNDFLIGTDVASAVALVIMAKEGTLGSKATSFDYESILGVRRGLAWLDRYFDIEKEPQFSRGARRVEGGDGGYMAWLFSIERLGMLLSIDELGGRRWYPTATRHLKTLQFGDGSFEERTRQALNGPVRTTCTALLFLLRATPSITNGKDE